WIGEPVPGPGDEGGAPSSTACSVRGRAGPRRAGESTFALVTGSIEPGGGQAPGGGPSRSRPATPDEARRATRSWWDAQSAAYQDEHGAFLGDAALVWGPEGLTEADAGLLGPVAGRRVLEVGAGAGQGARWLRTQGAHAVALDLSAAQL